MDILSIFVMIVLIGYIISLVEVIGSYILSVITFGNYSSIYLWTSILFPPLAFMFAWAIFSEANELYAAKQKNETEIDESFYGWIIHGFKTISQYSAKK